MTDPLIDLRAKITLDTDKVLDAQAAALGTDKSEIARQVLHEWAMKQVRFACALVHELTSESPDRTQRLEQGAERGKMVPSLRKTVLIRDNHTCQQCGAKDRDLHVDHITPISAGGKTAIENLQALCAPCNLKKGRSLLQLKAVGND